MLKQLYEYAAADTRNKIVDKIRTMLGEVIVDVIFSKVKDTNERFLLLIKFLSQKRIQKSWITTPLVMERYTISMLLNLYTLLEEEGYY